MPPFPRGFSRHRSYPRGSRLAFPHDWLGSVQEQNSCQLKNGVEPLVSMPLIGLMLRNIVVTNQQIHNILDARHKLSLRFLFPGGGSDLRRRHHHLRHGRLFHLHPETKLFTKRPKVTSRKFFYHITTPNEHLKPRVNLRQSDGRR
jgi:hypothetical protein